MLDTPEYERVMQVLAEHWRSGRIDAGEHERRTVLARNATDEAELAAALAGLPDAGAAQAQMPVIATSQPGAQVAEASANLGEDSESVDADAAQLVPSRRTNGLVRLDERVAQGIVALTPFAALVLFFVTGSWLPFLLIPVVAIAIYGPGGKLHE